MEITEKDLENIKKMKKKYKFLEGMKTDEIIDMFLSRCEHCGELCFASDLIPIPNFKGEVYKVCENCSSELLEQECSVDDKYLQYLEDRQEVEW